MADFKLFPGKPPQRVITALQRVVNLPQTTLQTANSWLRAHSEMLSTWNFEEVLYAAKEAPISPKDFHEILIVIFNFGFLIKNDEDFASAMIDLNLLGLEDEAAEKFKTLMEALRFPEAPFHRKVWVVANMAIPVVTDADVVCDLRGVFEEVASADASEHGVAKLIALTPVAVLSVNIEDESGRESSVVVQFTQTDFARFARMISRAEIQLREMAKVGRRE